MEHFSSKEKTKLWSLFDSIGKESEPISIEDEVLLIDGLNTFLRSWSVSPAMNDNGVHSGGMCGFLKSIGYAIKLLKPSKCVIVFDGQGGSMRRRKIYSDYKNKRKTNIRINRTYVDNSEEEQKSIASQLIRTVQYLECLPVTVVCVDNVEADDVIAYLAKDYFKNTKSVIMSSDKDFLQLVNDKIKVWSPTKKKLYGPGEIHSEYGISCENFINYRILEGDVSDNIDGIPGAGLKTIKKCFPMLEESKKYSIQEILNYSENNSSKYKLYRNVLDNKDILVRNEQLMQLTISQIQSFTQLRINEIVDTQKNKLNKFNFIKLITEDRIWNNLPNYGVWLGEVFSRLDSFVKP